jgi:rSAM/selenodomain-associated transferase 2
MTPSVFIMISIMISVIIPTLNAEVTLPGTLTALVPAAVGGLVREVIVVDGGSSDRTGDITDHAGANLVKTSPGRGQQLKMGAARARFPWLLFLHADTALESGWEHEASTFMRAVDRQELPLAAAAFRFALDDTGLGPRLLEGLVAMRCAALRIPYGDQGLLIPRRLYEEIGGHRPLPLMEDVELVRRLGRARLMLLRTRAVTSAARYRREGYLRRGARNLLCLTLWAAGVPISLIVRIYG